MGKKAVKRKTVNPHLIAAERLRLRREQLKLLAKQENLKLWKYLNMRKGTTLLDVQKASGWNVEKARKTVKELQGAGLAREAGGKIFSVSLVNVL